MKKRLSTVFVVALLILFGTLAVVQRPAAYHPLVGIDAPTGEAPLAAPNTSLPGGVLKLVFLLEPRSTLQSCEALTGNLARVTLGKCPTCSIRQIGCIQVLDADQKAMLTNQPLAVASGRLSTGTLTFSAANRELALSACRETEKQSAGGPQPVTCYAPESLRSKPAPKPIDVVQLGLSFMALLAAVFGAWLICWLIVKYEHLHAHLSHDHVSYSPQKFHVVPAPRIGGIGLVAGLMAAGAVMMLAEKLPHEREFGLLMLAGIPAFLGGLVEDITKKVGVLERLLLTMLSGAVAAWTMGAELPRLDVPVLDQALIWLPFAVAFTIFSVGGVANSINIIDGYNGLAAGFAIIVLAALAYVGYRVGDALVVTISVSLVGALLGFLAWNWPAGKIFLGDGGAYLLGFLLAELSVLLVARNPDVSPWFPLLLMIYPVFETFFSIYRKKVLRGHSPGKPDGLHFHMLIYKRIVPFEVRRGKRLSKLERNNRVSKYLLAPTAVIALIGCLFWRQTAILMLGAFSFCVLYVVGYRRILKWKMAPKESIRMRASKPNR